MRRGAEFSIKLGTNELMNSRLSGSEAALATLAARKIEAIKKMALSLGVDIFVNARTDVYLHHLVADEKKVQETLNRAAVYRSAGADGLFVPGLTNTGHIAQITRGTDLPVNLMASPELPNA